MVEPTHLGIFLDLKKIVIPRKSFTVVVSTSAGISMTSPGTFVQDQLGENVVPATVNTSPHATVLSDQSNSDFSYLSGHDGDEAYIVGWFFRSFFHAEYKGGLPPATISVSWPASFLEKDTSDGPPFFAAGFDWSWNVTIGGDGFFPVNFSGGLSYDNQPHGGIPSLTSKTFGGFSGTAKLKPSNKTLDLGSPGWNITTTGFA